MRLWAVTALAFLSVLLPGHSAAAAVQVTFVNSFHYPDLANSPENKREAMLEAIRSTLVELGARYLEPGAVLKIEVLDIGPVPIGHDFGDVQPSQMDLQYVLQKNGKIVLRDRETISDINYLQNSSGMKPKDPLSGEREMLRDWFAQRFGASRPAPN